MEAAVKTTCLRNFPVEGRTIAQVGVKWGKMKAEDKDPRGWE